MILGAVRRWSEHRASEWWKMFALAGAELRQHFSPNPSATILSRSRIRGGYDSLDGRNPHYRDEVDAAIAAALKAGSIVREFYDGESAAAYAKVDGSPVTDADLASDRAIREILAERFPEDAILSEEVLDDKRRLCVSRCWVVDPIDGTEQFIQRTGEFDVLVALVENGRPVAVAGYQPTTQLLLTATAGGGAWVRDGQSAGRPLHLESAGAPLRIGTSKWFGAPSNAAIITSIANCIGAVFEEPAATGFSPRMFLAPRTIDVMIGVRPGADQAMAD